MKMKSTLLVIILLFLSLLSAKANIYLVTSNADVGAGTLREAITFANSHPGADEIQFALADTSVAGRTITLTTILSKVIDQLRINGTTQAGTPFGISQAKIQITATSLLSQSLYLAADSCEVYGLFIQNFQKGILITNPYCQIGAIGQSNVIFNCSIDCIDVSETDHIAIVSNLIGIDTAQLVGVNVGIGIHVDHCTGVAIGGKSSDGRNIISGNTFGVNLVHSKLVDFNSNHIGTDLDGLTAIPNQWGIYATEENTNIEIGGDSLYEDNVISGNINAGIYGDFVGTVIQGNFIGTDVNGVNPLGNGTYGIYLTTGSNTDNIGGTDDHQGNAIAFNGNEGVYFQDNTCTKISIIRNRTWCNSQISGNGGFNFNGGNNNVPPPSILITSQYGATGITSPGARVDLFFDDTCSHCEGQYLVGSAYAASNGVWIIIKDISGTVTATMTDTAGNSSDYLTCTLVSDNPVCILGDFALPQESCAGIPLQFTDLSVTAPGTALATWSWTFGDGNNSTLQNPTHTYAAGGTYTVKLTVTNNQNCSMTVSKSFTVTIAPVASFISSQPACTGTSINFTDQSTVSEGDSIVSWHWDFGDGNTSEEQNPSHVFSLPGTYTVTLTATGLNCSNDAAQSVEIFDSPTANFSAPLQVCKESDFTFTDLSTAGEGDVIASWQWDFGDGGSSQEQNPDHVYLNAGTYTVTLTVTGSTGCTGEFSSVIEAIDLPTAMFTNAESSCAGTEISFTDQSTTGGDAITSWSWDFGDGNSSTDQNPSHAFTSGGAYSVSLTIQTSAGCSGEYSTSVTVYNPPSTVFISPIASCVGNEVAFTDESVADVGDEITQWQWNFGDGNSSSDQNPSNTYNTAGTYVVILTVTTSAGCSGEYDANIQIFEQPAASFDYTQAGLTINFSSTSTDNGNASYSWDFGDGNTSTEEDPSHTYSSTGVYDVCLTVYDSTCMSSSTSCLTIDLATGVSGLEVSDIHLYPNPANDEFVISGLTNSGIEKISVLNSIGQYMMQQDVPQNATTFEVNTKSLSQGIYIVKLQTSNEAVIEKKINIIH